MIFAISAFYFLGRRVWAAYGMSLCVVFAAGSFLCHSQRIESQARNASVASQISRLAGDQEVIVTAHIAKEVTLQSRLGEEVQKVDVETEQIQCNGISSKIVAGVRLTVFTRGDNAEPANGAAPTFRYGQRLRFPAKLSLPRNFHNPGAFDYESYLAEKRIQALSSVKSSAIEILPGFSGNSLERMLTDVHRSLIHNPCSLAFRASGFDGYGHARRRHASGKGHSG